MTLTPRERQVMSGSTWPRPALSEEVAREISVQIGLTLRAATASADLVLAYLQALRQHRGRGGNARDRRRARRHAEALWPTSS